MKSIFIKITNYKKYLSQALIALVLAGAVSCHTTIIETNPQSPEGPENQVAEDGKAPDYEETYISLGLGIYEYSEPDYVPCPGGVKSVKMERNVLDTVIHFFVGGIYTTRHVQVVCNK